MKTHSRALRRYHDRRIKNKAERRGLDVRDAEHMATCSCHMCGNPRKHWGEETIVEKRIEEKMDFEMNEVALECHHI